MSLKSFQVTLTGGTDAIVPAGDIRARLFIFANNATHAMTIGTSTLCTIPLNAAGNFYQNTAPAGFLNIAGWYVKGTAADKLDVIYDTGD
jgi:hypothetical protein